MTMVTESYREDNGKVLEVHVSGKLTHDDYERFVPEFDRLVEEHGKINLLFDMINFHGWKLRAIWDDTKFAFRHFGDMERLAMVGNKRWQKGMSVVCRPFTAAKIRYFDRAALDEARAWLGEATVNAHSKLPAHG